MRRGKKMLVAILVGCVIFTMLAQLSVSVASGLMAAPSSDMCDYISTTPRAVVEAISGVCDISDSILAQEYDNPACDSSIKDSRSILGTVDSVISTAPIIALNINENAFTNIAENAPIRLVYNSGLNTILPSSSSAGMQSDAGMSSYGNNSAFRSISLSLSSYSSRIMHVNAVVITNDMSDRLGFVVMKLQRYQNGRWADVYGWRNCYSDKTAKFFFSNTVMNLISNSLYRITATFYAKTGSKVISVTQTTESMRCR